MTKNTYFNLRCSRAELAGWKSLAEQSGLSFSEWVRDRLGPAPIVPVPEPVTTHVSPEISDPPEDSPPPSPMAKTSLCPRCARIQAPACPACRKASGLT